MYHYELSYVINGRVKYAIERGNFIVNETYSLKTHKAIMDLIINRDMSCETAKAYLKTKNSDILEMFPIIERKSIASLFN